MDFHKLIDIFWIYLSFINLSDCLQKVTHPRKGPATLKQKKIIQKIYGGRETSIEKYPSLVALFENQVHVCGGTIISLKAVITAAHCFEFRPPEITLGDYQIRAGTSHRFTGGRYYDILKLVIHGFWDTKKTNYDFALIRIKNSFVLSATVAIATVMRQEPPAGAKVHAVGWGAVSDTKKYSVELNEVELTVVGKKECRVQLSKFSITDAMLCAGYPKGGKDTCTGDSGGPLYYNKKLAGVTSWGDECGATTPGVYSNVAHVIEWIESFIKANQ